MREIHLDSAIQTPVRNLSDNLEKNLTNNLFNKFVIPEKIEVSQTAFYDLGFNPSFSIDGNFFYKKPAYDQQPFKSDFFHSLITSVYKIIKYFSQTSEQKAFQELVKIEKIWHQASLEKGMLYPPNEDNLLEMTWQLKTMPYMCYFREWQFFQKLSKIDNSPKIWQFFQKLLKIGNSPKIYAADLLRPLHYFNRPQVPSEDSKERILRGDCLINRDVARLERWGFHLLGNHTEQPLSHKEFLEAINVPGEQLKLSVRDLRASIRAQNYKEFIKAKNIFRDAWNNYINSHSLLKDLSILYSKKDYFAASYKAFEKDYRKMKKYNFNVDEEKHTEMRDKTDRRIEGLFLADQEHLKNELTMGEIANSSN